VLEALAQSHDAQKKAVSLLFSGKGKRRVSVGYVVESPIWKTTYRLVLGKEEAEKPYLQGWAVVENPSDEDWRDVRMALVSGRPISFRMDLYQPLYVPRPLVVPELFASLSSVAYGGKMDAEGAVALDDARRAGANRDKDAKTFGGERFKEAARPEHAAAPPAAAGLGGRRTKGACAGSWPSAWTWAAAWRPQPRRRSWATSSST
jgi:hypothetical protein